MFAWVAVPALVLLLAGPAMAQSVPAGTFDKIRQAGAIVLGVREASYPLSYFDASGRPIGYHLDICRRVVDAVKTRLDMADLAVRTVLVTSQSRIARVVDGGIDLECGSTTNNAARQRQVAFAPTTYVASVRVAVKRSAGITSLSQLDGKTVVTTTGSTSVELLKARQIGRRFAIREVRGDDHAQSFHLLETGQADAFVMDDNLLAGLIAASASPNDYAIVGEALSVEPIAIMLRRDDPAFKAVVDETVKAMMKNGEIGRLYAKWFMSPIPPRDINLGFPMGAVLSGLIHYPSDDPVEAFRPSE